MLAAAPKKLCCWEGNYSAYFVGEPGTKGKHILTVKASCFYLFNLIER